MAASNIDPNDANRKATENLRGAIERLNKLIDSRLAPTQEAMLLREKAATTTTGGGLSMMMPTALTDRFHSVAASPERAPTSGVGTDASMPPAEPYDEGIPGSQGRRRMHPSLPPGVDPEGQSAIKGMTNLQAQVMEDEPIRIPQFGDWQLDAYLKLGSQMAGKRALSQATKRSEAGEPAISPEDQGPMAAGNVSGILAQASQYAAPVAIAKQHLMGLMGHGQAAQEAGASLGFSPQTGAGPAYVAGFRNPLAMMTSEAGQQAEGQRLTAFSAARFGTGISEQQALGLRQGLAEEGFSNQEHGFLGLTTGGQQENLALALEPSVKEGLSPGVAKNFANLTRYGSGSLKELTDVTSHLGDVARTAKLPLDQMAQSIQEYTKNAEEHGMLGIEAARAGKEVTQGTGLPPTTVAQLNQSPFALAAAAQMGVRPGQVPALKGPAQEDLAFTTIQNLQSMVPQEAKENKYGPKGELLLGAKENELAWIKEVGELQGISGQQIEHMFKIKEHAPERAHMKEGLSAINKQVDSWQRGQKNTMPTATAAGHIGATIGKTAAQTIDPFHWLGKVPVPGASLVSGAADALTNAPFELGEDIIGGIFGGGGHKKSKAQEEGEKRLRPAIAQLRGEAEKIQIPKPAIDQISKLPMEAQAAAYEKQIEKQTEAQPEEQGLKGVIGLTPEAARFFKIQDPKAAASKEAKAGGTPSNAESNKNFQRLSPHMQSMIQGAERAAEAQGSSATPVKE
jgi:hypothetical protein